MKSISVSSKEERKVIDITNQIEEELPKSNGAVNIFIKHTTAAITTADLDPGTDLDYLKVVDFLQQFMPNLNFNHPHDPDHFPDHFFSSLIGTSITIPFKKGKLDLGTWQRVVLIELNGPKTREITLTFSKELRMLYTIPAEKY